MTINGLGRGTAAALAVIVFLPALLLWRPLFTSEVYLPFDLSTFPPYSVALTPEEIAQRRQGANYDITEKSLLCTPEYELARSELAAGRLPHWNPYVRAGAPLFANALEGFAYPPHWLLFLIGPERGFAWLAWLAFATAGALMLGFLRAHRLDVLPALFGAVVFSLSLTMTANAHFFMRMESLIWLPGGFWALLRLSEASGVGRLLPLLGLALCTALTWLAGFPPFALVVSCAFALYALHLAWHTLRARGGAATLRLLTWCAAGAVLGLLLAAVQLVPMVDYFPHAQRNLDPPLSSLPSGGLDPLGWLGFLLPAPFGDPGSSRALPYDQNPIVYLLTSRRDAQSGRLFLPGYNFTEYALYIGALPLLFAGIALTSRGSRLRSFALLALVLFLALATGGALLRILAHLPPFRAGPPMRFAGVACFFAATLAALGLQQRPSDLTPTKRALLLAVAIVVALACAGLHWEALRRMDDPRSGDEILAAVTERWKTSYPEQARRERVQDVLGPFVAPALRRIADEAAHGMRFYALATAYLAILLFTSAGARRRAMGIGAIAITASELLLLAFPINPSVPHRELSDTPVHRFLRARRDELGEQGGYTVARAAATTTAPRALPPNLLVPDGIRDLNSYTFVDGRSHLPFERLYGPEQALGRTFVLLAFPDDPRLDHGLFDLFGVRYLLSEVPLEGRTPAIEPLHGPGGSFYVYERPSALPRALLVPDALQATDEEALRRMTAGGYAPRKLILLQERMDQESAAGSRQSHPKPVAEGETPSSRTRPKAASPPPRLLGTPALPHTKEPSHRAGRDSVEPYAAKGRVPAPASNARVSFRKDTPTEIRLSVHDSPGAWLVLADVALPHWHAELDDEPAPWWRANLLFRALWIPAGDHTVRFFYIPAPFYAGMTGTVIGLLACGTILLVVRRRAARAGPPA